MYAIMGITGRVGGAIAENLLAQGEQIRAIVRDPEKAARWRDRGAEIAVADCDDANALASAFEGTDGVFVMVPPNFAPAPGFPEARKTLASYHAALAKALPKKAVYLSSIGAEQAGGLGLITNSHLLEQTLEICPSRTHSCGLAGSWKIMPGTLAPHVRREEFSPTFILWITNSRWWLRLTLARPGRMSCVRSGRAPGTLRSPVPRSIPPTTLQEH
jgi:hypothetical protein